MTWEKLGTFLTPRLWYGWVACVVLWICWFASMGMGHQPPLDLHFTTLEVAAVVLAVGVVALVSQDGETHWMEGVMLLGVYAILALAFFHFPSPASP